MLEKRKKRKRVQTKLTNREEKSGVDGKRTSLRAARQNVRPARRILSIHPSIPPRLHHPPHYTPHTPSKRPPLPSFSHSHNHNAMTPARPPKTPTATLKPVPRGSLRTLMALPLEAEGVEAAEAPEAWEEEGAVVVGLDVPAELAPEDPPPETDAHSDCWSWRAACWSAVVQLAERHACAACW